MNLASFIPSDASIMSTVAILALGWIGVIWLRNQQREGYQHESFRTAVTKIFSEAQQTDAYRERMEKVVGTAVASSFDPITRSLGALAADLKEHEKRIVAVEVKVEGVLGRLQAQRKGDVLPERADS